MKAKLTFHLKRDIFRNILFCTHCPNELNQLCAYARLHIAILNYVYTSTLDFRPTTVSRTRKRATKC